MGYLGQYAGAFLGAYLGAVEPVVYVPPVAYRDYIGTFESLLPDPRGYRGAFEEGEDGYRGELAAGTEYVGVLADGTSYRGALEAPEESVMSFSMVAGNRLPSLERICTNAETGEVVDLTGGTAVSRFKIGEDGPVKTGAVVITDAEAGEVRCDWAADDLDAEGICYLRVVVTISGKTMTFPSDGSSYTFPVAAAF